MATTVETHPGRRRAEGMETLVGYILLVGVLASMVLMVIGLVWLWMTAGTLQLASSLTAQNLFDFLLADARAVSAGAIGPTAMIDAGLAVLLLTPYVRVLASMLYFALAERSMKYTLFTAFVCAVLTYSLFVR